LRLTSRLLTRDLADMNCSQSLALSGLQCRPAVCRLQQLLVLLLLAIGFSTAGDAAAPGDRVPRVLFLYPYDERIPGTNLAGEAARARLLEATDGKIDLFSEFLDLSRFGEPAHVDRMARYLSEKYTSHRPDVVVALGEEAVRFIVANRSSIAPGARIVFCGFSAAEAANLNLPVDVVGAFTEFDITKTFQMAKALQPGARHVVVFAGSAPFDQSWLAWAQRDLAGPAKGYDTTYVTDVSIDEFAERASRLQKDTILIILTVFADRTGRNFIPRDAVDRIAAVSGAPVYGPYSTYVGHRVVGGNTVMFESMGLSAANLALNVVAGKRIADLVVPQTYLADARELKRWGLSESMLPPGTVVSFKEKTLWEEHWVATSTIFGFVALQSFAIAALLFERRRRHAAELQSRGRLLELVHLNQSATAGALSASIAHELNQPLGAIRSNAEAAEVVLGENPPNIKLVRQILADIVDDDQRASDIIVRLRGLLKKRSDIDWQEFDLNEIVRSSLRILEAEAGRRGVAIIASQVGRNLPVRADRVHLQQVVLNLLMNAMDAVAPIASPRVTVKTALLDEFSLELSISDTGSGIPKDQLGNVFDAFYTTKADGPWAFNCTRRDRDVWWEDMG
jgi:signal transduction histidine kinase